MSSILNNFIPGDRVEGTKAEFWKRRGRIAESHATLAKTKILVRWDGATVDEIVPRASIKVIDTDMEESHNDDDEESEGGGETSLSDAELDIEDRESDQTDEDEEEEEDHGSEANESDGDLDEGGSASNGNTPAHTPVITSDVNTIANGTNTQPTTSQESGRSGRGGRGRGRSGRGRGAGRDRGGAPPTVVPPPPPVPPTAPSPTSNIPLLHAILKKATKTRPPVVREWTEVPNVVQDLQTGFFAHEQYTRLNWRDPSIGMFPPDLDIPILKTPLQYFLLMFPMQQINLILECTNTQMRIWRRGSPVTKGELFCYIGLRLTIALHPRSSDEGLDFYWNTEVDPELVFSPIFDFGNNCGMSKSRFEAITKCLRLDSFKENSAEQDPYKPIQSFIDAFNNRLKIVVVPGKYIIVDECISFWKGVESLFSHESFIHVTYIPRKPVNLGVEFKCSADGQSNIMLFLEIQKGSNAPKQKYETEPEKLPFHCAVTLRTVDNWTGSGRVVVADAAFGSVMTCTELLKRGLYFIGVIKGCTKGFPVAFAQKYLESNPTKNDYKVITTIVKDGSDTNRTLMSVLYCLKPGMLRQLISSYSSSILGDEKKFARSIRKQNENEGIWFNEREVETIRRPKVIDEGMKYFGAVDYNDRFRQGYLNWEQAWSTKRIWKRMFTTVLGVIATNAYFAYRLESLHTPTTDNEHDDKLKFFGFLSRLAQQLINNSFDSSAPVASALRSRSSPAAVSPGLRLPILLVLHDAEGIRDRFDTTTEEGKEKSQTYQRDCKTCRTRDKSGKLCRVKASYYCSECSAPEIGKFVCFCGPRAGRNCWANHLASCHSVSSEEFL